MLPSECILSKTPEIGEFVILYDCQVGLIVNWTEDYVVVYNINRQKIISYERDEITAISEELVPLLSKLTPNMRTKIIRLVPDQEDDYLFNYFPTMKQRVQLLDDLITNNLTSQIQDIILSNGIKQIIQHEKGNGNRIVELHNGEIWRVHRVKKKKSRFIKRAVKQFHKHKYVSNRTTHYELIEKIC